MGLPLHAPSQESRRANDSQAEESQWPAWPGVDRERRAEKKGRVIVSL